MPHSVVLPNGQPANLICADCKVEIPQVFAAHRFANQSAVEREAELWRERWYGSEPQKGSAIVDRDGGLVAYFGGDRETHQATTATVSAHNAIVRSFVGTDDPDAALTTQDADGGAIPAGMGSVPASVSLGPCLHLWAQQPTTGSWSCIRCNEYLSYDNPPLPESPKPTASGGADREDEDEFATVEKWEHEDQRELSLLYNHAAHDRPQFNRGQMREAIRHGRAISAIVTRGDPALRVMKLAYDRLLMLCDAELPDSDHPSATRYIMAQLAAALAQPDTDAEGGEK